MKPIALFIFVLFLWISCGNKKEKLPYSDANFVEKPYDTIAVDSFSAGAVSVDVARQIRMSSQKYKDSVKEALLKAEEERKLNELKLKLEKEAADQKSKEIKETKAAETEKTKVEGDAAKTE